MVAAKAISGGITVESIMKVCGITIADGKAMSSGMVSGERLIGGVSEL